VVPEGCRAARNERGESRSVWQLIRTLAAFLMTNSGGGKIARVELVEISLSATITYAT
jgi:hypothetical protein